MNTGHGTWGVRTRTFRTESCIVTILFLKPNKRCSWHKHNTAYNQFFVIEGRLGVKTDIGPEESNETIVERGQSFTVPPGVTHEFFTLDRRAVVEEIAYVLYDETDILRSRLGGDVEA